MDFEILEILAKRLIEKHIFAGGEQARKELDDLMKLLRDLKKVQK